MVEAPARPAATDHDGGFTVCPMDRDAHRELTREAYDRLAPVWSATTDDGPWNGHLERPAFRSMIPQPLKGASILDAGCGSGANAEWFLGEGAEVTGIDLSPAMIDETRRRCDDRGCFNVADLAEPLGLDPASLDGVACSLAMHYLEDWTVPLRSFAHTLRPGGWFVFSTEHPVAPPLPSQRGNYFDTELVSAIWRKKDIEVEQHFWRRPLGAVIDACRDAGFTLDRVAEPCPSTEALAAFPEDLEPFAHIPTFIIYRFILDS